MIGAAPTLPGTGPGDRHLVIVAHVDDDGLGLGAIIRSLRDVSIVYLTDSAPRHPRFFAVPCGSRQVYARWRRREAMDAAAWLSVPATRLHFLEAVDMEAFRDLERLDVELDRLATQLRPTVVWSTAYDGGHPDHDVAAFLAARLASRRSWQHYQFALYRGDGKSIRAAEFASGPAGTSYALSDTQIEHKQHLLRLYRSQQALMRHFDPSVERFRRAISHDFGQRPTSHPTPYEAWKWPVQAEMLISAFEALASTPPR